MAGKALASAADTVFLDLEDAVAPDEKAGARKKVIQALKELDWQNRPTLYRANALDTPYFYRDIIEVVEEAGNGNWRSVPKTYPAFVDVEYLYVHNADMEQIALTNLLSIGRRFSGVEFEKPLVNSTFTLALVTGLSVTDIFQNVFANLGWEEVRLPAPVFEGDTIYSQSEVLEKRESKSRENVGLVTVKTTGYNQNGETVITFMRTVMVYKRGHAPSMLRPNLGDTEGERA
jgi:acyl dehydratase